MTLVVNITGGENIDQGEQVTLSAAVTDANGNTPQGTLQYAWSASRGSFIGDTDEATAVYHADFTDAADVDVTITCAVTRPANASPTVSSGSLTAMAALGITGQILNMFLNPTADTSENARSDIHPGGTLVAGSDSALASNINITQLEWNDNTNRFIMTGSGGGDIGAFWTGNTTQSVFIIFSDGTVLELDSTDLAVTTASRAQWNVTDGTLQQKFVDLDGMQSLLVGVGNRNSIGWTEDTGSDTETFTAAAVEAFTVNITGTTEIEQNQQTTLTAEVTDSNGNTITSGLTYTWSASRGNFVGDATGASVVYHADFTDTSDIAVTIRCSVTRAASETPTSSGAGLTAMSEIGITGQILNMYLNPAGAVSPNQNNNIYQDGSTGTLAANSDAALASNITINRLRWNNSANRFILNSSGAGHLGNFWSGNTTQSIFLIFEGGQYVELPNSAFALGGSTWAQFNVPDTTIRALLNAFDGTDDLLIGVGATDSIGIDAGAGSGTATVTAQVPLPLSIEAIDEQFIAIGTKDYDLIIDITGNPDTVEATGHMEGFSQHWDAAKGQLHIRAEEVTRLISGVFWTVEIRKGTQVLTADIAYHVIPAAPILEALPMIHLYKGVPINVDVVIENIPPLIIPNARLLGLKSELVEYGVNVGGKIPRDANLSLDSGDVTLMIPSDTGETSDMHDYPYVVEAGTPPAIGTPEFTPKGRYGELTFDDVNHALGYEWTLGEDDAAAWNFFSEARTVIDPSTVEITPGNLSVTLKFPNIAGASSYEYMLESERTSSAWIRFTGTFSNGMITTIIPDLEDGVEYTLRLRVASPWVGTPISVKVYGGRLAYCIHDASTGDSILYLFHTGVANGGTATRIKRVLLPTTLTTTGGLAVDADRNVYILNTVDRGEKALYVFNASVIDAASDGDRIAPSKKNPLPSDVGSNADGRGLSVYNNELYMLLSSTAAGTGVFRSGRTIASLYQI